ncbi:MAG: putative addiction module antidote protein [Acidobacteria bacterium]|nr:putative addiction module antidote protein [Acidobacteriota bacterium]
MAEKFSRYDTAEYLETEEDIRHYLEACQEDGDPTLIAVALGDIARARNMTDLARSAGMTRAGLYKALSPTGNPSFATISKVARALGLRVKIELAP